MPERREERPIRTDRPSSPDSLPTVREVLALEAVRAGDPEVLVGDGALDAQVRWVHASDSAGVARLLDGGELLLSTGSSWPEDPAELRALVRALVHAGIAAIFVELGSHYRYVPAVVIEAARAERLALVALRREVKFVTITEAVHRRIIADQTAALRAREEVRTRFTTLALRGTPADFIVRQLAQTLGAPVVLESLAHDVIVAEVPLENEVEVLTRWEVRSRIAHREGAGEWDIVPVEARGIRWGFLVALPGPSHPAGRTAVLEQGAMALALGRLTAGDDDEWGRLGRHRLIDALLTGRYSSTAGMTARLEAAGLPIESARVHGVVVSGSDIDVNRLDAGAAALGGRALVGATAPEGVPGPAMTMLVSLPARTIWTDAAVRSMIETAAPGAVRVLVSVGSAAAGADGALASLQEAIDLARAPLARGARGIQVRRAEQSPLARLVTALRDDHRVLEHGERMLAPLIEYDLSRGGDLLDVLAAMLAHPGNRTAAAGASHLSRSVFYQRIALIQDLLEVDLDDGEIQTALHLALLVRRAAG